MKIAVLASGAGTTFEAVARACASKVLTAEIVLLASDKPGCGAVEAAKSLSVPTQLFPVQDFSDREEWDRAMCRCLVESGAELIILAGFLKLLGPQVLSTFSGNIINTHPSLLPKFGGKGMFGRRVHQAVLDSGEQETGVSVHVVTENYDEGPVIGQSKVVVLPEDTVEQLEDRVKAIEKEFLISVLNKWIQEKRSN